MKSNSKFFKNAKALPIDKFFNNVLYDKKFGYYTSRLPFGKNGDFITAPRISKLYSEMIAVWIISTWEIFGKPKKINIVELGPGDGCLMRDLLDVFKRFPEFNLVKNIYLYEVSNFLKKSQKRKLKNENIKWVENFNNIKKGPVIVFGNEFFDAIPVKQFKKKKNTYCEKYYSLKKDYSIKEIFKNASNGDVKSIKSFKSLNNLNFIEFPKFGFDELKKVIKLISRLKGCLLMVDYGYLKSNNQNTLQSVLKHKKNNILSNLGKADVTSHVNFSLLSEFFLKNNLKVKSIVTQRKFLEKMGIFKRAEIISKKMKFSDKSNLYLRLKRLLSPRSMGELFKVILAYKYENDDFYGFN